MICQGPGLPSRSCAFTYKQLHYTRQKLQTCLAFVKLLLPGGGGGGVVSLLLQYGDGRMQTSRAAFTATFRQISLWVFSM